MKLLEYTLFRNCKHEQRGLLGELCHCGILNLAVPYATVLGFIGVFLNLHDIVTVITFGKVLPCHILRKGVRSVTDILSPELTRDVKLISLVLSLQYYLFLIIGSILKNGMFFIPWMVFYSILNVFELSFFAMRTYFKGIMFNKYSLILSIFVVFNWLTVFCAYNRIKENQQN